MQNQSQNTWSKDCAPPIHKSPEQSYHFFIKSILLGEPGTGKSSLLQQYLYQGFNQSYLATIGVDFKCCEIEVDGVKVKLQIWDTPSQQMFKSISSSYIKGSKLIWLVYDCCKRQTFEKVTNHLKGIDEFHQNMPDIYICLIANKCDLVEGRVVSSEEGMAYAAELGLNYAECSAKDFGSIKSTFEIGVDWLLKNNKLSVKK